MNKSLADNQQNRIQLLDNYWSLLKQRIENFKLSSFGEDTIRYDFCFSAIKTLGIEPFEVQLEVEIPGELFIHGSKPEKPKQGRHERKPEMDLMVDNYVCEFAFFRKQKSTQPATKNHGKLINDMIRLAMYKTLSDNTKSHYMVCLTDSHMIKYGQPSEGKRGPKATPIQEEYIIDKGFLRTLPRIAMKPIQEQGFWGKAVELDIIPEAKRIYSKTATINDQEFALWVWEISVVDNRDNR